jgi:cytidylate kinase
MKATIAISRLIGSEGTQIAHRVAESLGYTVVNRNVLEGIFRQYGLAKFGELYTSAPNVWDLANAKNLEIVSMLNETMEALANRGQMLIVGRAGFASLGKYADVLNVRLQAPFSVRVERLMSHRSLTNRLSVEREVKADDEAREKFVSRFYHHGWEDASDFDLVIDTHTISVQMAIDWIVEATQALERKELGVDAVTAQQVKVDPILSDAIDISLARQLPGVNQDLGKN